MSSEERSVPIYLNFVFGGAGGMIAFATLQALQLLKSRMQLAGFGPKRKQYRTSVNALVDIIRNEGVTTLYAGLSASLLKQITYTATRIGVYNTLVARYAPPTKTGDDSTFLALTLCGMTAGSVGAFVGTPAEVCTIRMSVDGLLPEYERRNYKHVFDALVRIVREEGATALFRGGVPTIYRAMVVNVAQLSTYSYVKRTIVERDWYANNSMELYVAASMIAGLTTAVVGLPLDIIKTRIQYMKTSCGRVTEYDGIVDVLRKLIRKEGVRALWRGFTPYYFKVGSRTVLLLVSTERLYDWFLGEED